MRLKNFAAAAATICALAASTPANAAPAAVVEVCITDFRVQTSNARHSISGFGRIRDGRLFAYSIAATDMVGIVGTTSITPTVAGPGTGYIAGQEPELIRTIEHAAADGAWLRISLEASTGVSQRVLFVARSFPQTGNCAS